MHAKHAEAEEISFGLALSYLLKITSEITSGAAGHMRTNVWLEAEYWLWCPIITW